MEILKFSRYPSVFDIRRYFAMVSSVKHGTGRTVEGKFSVSVIWKNGSVGLAKDYTETITDTIAVSDLPSIEHPTLRAARGEPPAQGFFDSLLEPFVILGTLAIAVYLLFTVRS